MATISLYKGEKATIVDADLALVSQYKWALHTDGYATAYAVRNGKRTTVKMHRLICGEPVGLEADHRGHNPLNCQRSNLRLATHHQNQGNRASKRSGKTSKYKDVCWLKTRKRWRAQITKKPKVIHLGNFESETEAAKAYDRAAVEYFGEFALTNF